MEYVNEKIKAGANINERDEHGYSLLQLAVCDPVCKVEDIKRLLDLKADINVTDEWGMTLLHLVFCYKYSCSTEVVRLLLDRGVAIEALDRGRNSALAYALLNPSCELNVIKLLLDRGANINFKSIRSVSTVLHCALRNFCIKTDVIKFLLNKAALVNVVNILGMSPLYVAVKDCTSNDTINLLLENGALIDLSPDFSPLRTAIRNYSCYLTTRSFECVKLLIIYAFFQGVNVDSGLISHNNRLSVFVQECAQEFNKMNSEFIAVDMTLHQFISRQSQLKSNITTVACKEDGENILNNILKLLIDDRYPIYREVILSKLARPYLIEKINEHPIYTEARSSRLVTNNKTVLNCDDVCCVVRYLPRVDLLNLLLAFRTNDHCSVATLIPSWKPNKKIKMF